MQPRGLASCMYEYIALPFGNVGFHVNCGHLERSVDLDVQVLCIINRKISGSSWNLVKKCSNIDILLSCFDISHVDITELASRS